MEEFQREKMAEWPKKRSQAITGAIGEAHPVPDPFDGVWEDEIEPLHQGMIKTDQAESATTIIDWLAEQHPGRFKDSIASCARCNDDYTD